MLKRVVYFFYYLKEVDFRKLRQFLNYASQISKRSQLALLIDSALSSFKYNISILDYFYFRFYSKEVFERKLWAGTGFMYEYQLRMNPLISRSVLADKIEFLQKLRKFTKRNFNTYEQLVSDPTLLAKWLHVTSGKVVLKNSKGQVGAEVQVVVVTNYTEQSLLELMAIHKFDLIEEFVTQHDQLMALSASGLNTIRVISQIHANAVNILAARIRISINSPVDNLAAGNIACSIDLSTGRINGPGIFSDITKSSVDVHPVSLHKLYGFQIPFWNEVLKLVEDAASSIPENKSIGWDVAITNEGPLLIEGNHNWCKLLWQLPVGRGLKGELEIFDK